MLEFIKDIVNTWVVLDICTDNQTLTVKENESSSKIKKLHIQGIPNNTFAFTLDYKASKAQNPHCFQQLSCYSNKKTKFINKGCDLVLIFSTEDRSWKILILDLKSDRLEKEDEKQLVNSELYVRYLLSMAEEYYNVDIEKVKFIRVIVTTSERNIKKGATYYPNQIEKNESFKPFSVTPKNKEAYVYLNQLLG
jgi:hypothetical protein